MSIESMLIIESNTGLPQKQIEIDRPLEHLLQLMQVVNSAVWLTDKKLNLVAQNEIACKILGWSSAEAVGRSICDLASSDNDSSCELAELFSQAMEKQQSVFFDKGILMVTKEKQHILVRGKMSPVIHQNQAVGAVCSFSQITPEESNTYLRFEFADMASHLLRTPLSFIQTSIGLLMNVKLDADEQKAILSRMQKQNQRLKDFVNELLKILRLETEGMQTSSEPIAISPLIERVLDLVRYEQPHHTFEFHQPNDSLLMVMGDPTKTELILLNLLLSAVRRCPNGGHITVQSERQGAEVIIGIIDDGRPIPIKLLDKAFWQFYPVDDEDGKMPSTYQLGLYTTKQFVESQNGRIWAESQAGRGSKFSFSMPALRGEKNQWQES